MSPKEKINKILIYLNITAKELAESIGFNRPDVIYHILNERNGISRSLANKINNKYNINVDWLLTGEGEMLNGDSSHNNNNKQNSVEVSYKKGVPYFEDIESTGSIIQGKAMNGTETPTFLINYEHFNDCTAYIQHVGDSMYPKYCSGEIIAVKRIFNLDIVLWGEAYLVVTNDDANNLRTVKLVFQHDDPDKIVLRSSNPNYKGDTIINKKDIISMFIVKGKITRNQL